MTHRHDIGPATIYQGDVLDGLAEIPDGSVHTCITSPPYWGLRDYGIEGMIGLEPTLQEWLDRMVAVCREIRRVLREDGTFWLNLGDAYNSQPGQRKTSDVVGPKQETNVGSNTTGSRNDPTFKPKDLLMMPARLALALQAEGWWVRSDIIWSKPNPMPESVTDRPTSAHEHIYLLTRSARYYYDAEAVREENVSTPHGDVGYQSGNIDNPSRPECYMNEDRIRTGRNLRNVWVMATQPYPEAHFATFPEELPRKCILAGTSERGCCPECGAPWERITERVKTVTDKQPDGRATHEGDHGSYHREGREPGARSTLTIGHTIGWNVGCKCDKPSPGAQRRQPPYDPIPCTVLDPFAGSGTTLYVARTLGRRAIGIELSPDYVKLALRRLDQQFLF